MFATIVSNNRKTLSFQFACEWLFHFLTVASEECNGLEINTSRYN